MELTKKQLEQRLELATMLGFWGDALHWKQELLKLEKESNS